MPIQRKSCFVRMKMRELMRYSNVVAYTASATPPMPFRFKSSNLRFQVPDLGFGSLVQNTRFFKVMSQTATWRAVSTTYYTLKTWMRRTIWGDRVSHALSISIHDANSSQLFLRFEGPTTMLLQSRGSRVSDVLTLKDVNEIAESQPGAIQDAVDRKIKDEIKQIGAGTVAPDAQQSSVGTVKYATIRDGKAKFESNPPAI